MDGLGGFGCNRYRLFDCGTVVLPIWRCASTSLTKNSRSKPVEPRHGAIVFIRDPLERLVSAYSWLRKGFVDWHHFVDVVLWAPVDGHWQPQADIIDDGFEKHVMRLEDIGRVFPWLPRLNETKELPRVDLGYRNDELRAFYAADFELI